MKRTFTLLVALTLVCCGRSEDRPTVPDGITYRFLDDAQIPEIRTFLLDHFARGEVGVGELFESECMCAPGYWRFVGSKMVAPQLQNFSIPNRRSGKTYDLAGAHLKDPQDLKALAASVAADIGKTPVIRRLSTKEIAQLWVVVPFDIEEPVFVVESRTRRLVVCLKSTSPSGWRIWWTDALTEYDWGE